MTHFPDSTSSTRNLLSHLKHLFFFFKFMFFFFLFLMNRPRSPVTKDAGVLLNNGVTQPHSVPAFPALTNPFVPLKVIVISADLSQKPGWKNKLLHRKLTFFEPFQHPATDSRHTILWTKCHLSYYKFSAEYSADPKGLRTKRAYRQGHFWNAMRELPQSFLMRGFCTDASTGTWTAAIAHHKDACWSVSVSSLCSMIYLAPGRGLSPWMASSHL